MGVREIILVGFRVVSFGGGSEQDGRVSIMVIDGGATAGTSGYLKV